MFPNINPYPCNIEFPHYALLLHKIEQRLHFSQHVLNVPLQMHLQQYEAEIKLLFVLTIIRKGIRLQML